MVRGKSISRLSAILIWMTLAGVILLPLLAAANSPLLAWRDPYYITAGFAGIIAMDLLLVQPLLVGGYLPGYSGWRGRRFHKWAGAALVTSVIIHIVGLWITSPPDVIDVLLFRSPTPFSDWGAIAMWALFAAAIVAAFRRRLPLPARKWRVAHTGLVILCVTGSLIHAMLIEGTMELLSKTVLCALVLLATVKTVFSLKVWARGSSR